MSGAGGVMPGRGSGLWGSGGVSMVRVDIKLTLIYCENEKKTVGQGGYELRIIHCENAKNKKVGGGGVRG